MKKNPKPPILTEEKEIKNINPEVDKTDAPIKDKTNVDSDKEISEKGKSLSHPTKEKLKGKEEIDSPTVHLGLDSDSESELVIDLGEDQCGREGRKNKKEPKESPPKQEGRISLCIYLFV